MLSMGGAVPGTGRRDAIITTSLDGRILFWSPGAKALLGYREREVVGRPIAKILPEKYQRLDLINVEEVTLGHSVRNTMVKHVREDGTTVRCLQTMLPIRDGSQKIVATLRIILDLSSTMDARLALQKSIAQVAELAADPGLNLPVSPHSSSSARHYRGERVRTIQEYLRVVESETDQLQVLLDELRSKTGILDDDLSMRDDAIEDLAAAEV